MKHIAAHTNTPSGAQTPIAILDPVDKAEAPPFIGESLLLVGVDENSELKDV